MNKLIGSVIILLMLVGCSGKSTTTSNDMDILKSSPTASIQEPSAYLEVEKLRANFGFADVEGKHILVTGHEKGLDKEMALLNKAIGDNGKVLSLSFEKWQAGNESSNGRETAYNFANLPGYLYKVEEGAANIDKTYYLTESVDFNQEALLPIQPIDVNQAPTAVEESVRTSITTAKQRELQQIWKLADLSTNRQLYLVQFVREDKDMLFSLVLKEEDKFTFMDYPAVIQEDEYSVWRVDDGGEVIPEMFSILFAAETPNGLLLGMEWWGAEGVNTFFLNKNRDSFKEMDIHYGRYTSPI